jgi:hypothetical protein
MDKAQAIDYFWNSFGLMAFDENTVPKWAQMPYITYNISTDSLDNVVSMSASLWYRTTSWKDITNKANEIEKYLGEHGGIVLKLNEGRMWINKGTPFIQRINDPDDSIRRIRLNIQTEFLTAF